MLLQMLLSIFIRVQVLARYSLSSNGMLILFLSMIYLTLLRTISLEDQLFHIYDDILQVVVCIDPTFTQQMAKQMAKLWAVAVSLQSSL